VERTQTVGPYLLVRPHRTKLVTLYTVHWRNEPDTPLAVIVKITAPDVGLPEEYGIRCSDPKCGMRKFYPDRDRCLAWLTTHQVTKHT
jgi:hypothetical protein